MYSVKLSQNTPINRSNTNRTFSKTESRSFEIKIWIRLGSSWAANFVHLRVLLLPQSQVRSVLIRLAGVLRESCGSLSGEIRLYKPNNELFSRQMLVVGLANPGGWGADPLKTVRTPTAKLIGGQSLPPGTMMLTSGRQPGARWVPLCRTTLF